MPSVGTGKISSGSGGVDFGGEQNPVLTLGTSGLLATSNDGAIVNTSNLSTLKSVNGSNIGDGIGVFAGVQGNENAQLEFKSLMAGDGISISSDTQRILISSSATLGASQLPNTGVVTGTYINATIAVDSKGRITFAATGSNADVSNAANSGSGIGLFQTKASGILNFKSIKVDTASGINISTSANEVTLSLASNIVRGVVATAGLGMTITGSPITTTGTLNIAMTPSGVSAGNYTYPTITVDTSGRITAATNGTIPAWAGATLLVSGVTQGQFTKFDFPDTTITNLGSGVGRVAINFPVSGISNLGLTGEPVTALTSGTLNVKRISGTGGIAVTSDSNKIIIDGTALANTLAIAQDGTNIVTPATKLNFIGATVSNATNGQADITIATAPINNLSNLGSVVANSAEIFDSIVSNVARLRRVVGSGGINISQSASSIVIDG